MRRYLSALAGVTALLAVSGAIASAGAAPGKLAPKPKSPPLKGTVVRSEDMDLRVIIPDGWEPMAGTGGITNGKNGVKSKRTPVYYLVASTDNVELKGRITYYNPPQFAIENVDLTGVVDENEVTQAQLDELAKSLAEKTNQTAINFRFEGSRRITVDGEPATAFACVATMPRTQDLMRFRVVSMFRNKHVYLFTFGAPVDDFPRYDSLFTKMLQNYHFLTPRKKNAPRPVAPEDAPVKKDGVF